MVLKNPKDHDDRIPDTSGFVISSVTGLGPVGASVNTTEMVGDGDHFNSARIGKRNIVLNLEYYSEEGNGIETVRLASYKLFPLKSKVYIEVETDVRKAYTYGYVEKNEPDIFSESTGAQVSLICPDPKWYDSDHTQTTLLLPNQGVNFTYAGEAEVGGILHFDIQAPVIAPISSGHNAFSFSCTNSDGEGQNFWMYTTDDGFDINDVIRINSTPGEKYCVWIDDTDGETKNSLQLLNRNPEWIVIKPGSNTIYITDTNNAIGHAYFVNPICYEGV
jgi:hypothetical protein